MISYNHETYIRQAIESILSQSVDFPIELIIGDDCSTDRTAEICEEFARLDSRVRMLPTERNLGVMPNFARTLRACEGEYIAICEGDDYWTDPRKLKEQIAFLESNQDYSGCAHQSQIIIDNKAVCKFKDHVPAIISTVDLTGGRLFHTASLVFRKPAVELLCNSPAVLSCDRLLNLCVSFLGNIYYSDETMCVYRIHGSGMSSNATVAQMKLDLNCITYLAQLQSSFPKYRYTSYVYATIGLAKSARWHQKAAYLALSFLYSFSYFPDNLVHGFNFFRKRIFRSMGA